jgi:hypothetical protein
MIIRYNIHIAVWYSLWSFSIPFPFWYVCTKKNLATLDVASRFFYAAFGAVVRKLRMLVVLSN